MTRDTERERVARYVESLEAGIAALEQENVRLRASVQAVLDDMDQDIVRLETHGRDGSMLAHHMHGLEDALATTDTGASDD